MSDQVDLAAQLERVLDLVAMARALCPERLPAPDRALDDRTLAELWAAVLARCGLLDCTEDFAPHLQTEWLIQELVPLVIQEDPDGLLALLKKSPELATEIYLQPYGGMAEHILNDLLCGSPRAGYEYLAGLALSLFNEEVSLRVVDPEDPWSSTDLLLWPEQVLAMSLSPGLDALELFQRVRGLPDAVRTMPLIIFVGILFDMGTSPFLGEYWERMGDDEIGTVRWDSLAELREDARLAAQFAEEGLKETAVLPEDVLTQVVRALGHGGAH
jgi:hypothetical protein